MFYKMITSMGPRLFNLRHVENITCSKNVIYFDFQPIISGSFLYVTSKRYYESFTYNSVEDAQQAYKNLQKFIESHQGKLE